MLPLQVKTSSDAYRSRRDRSKAYWEWEVGGRIVDEGQWFALVDLQGWPDSSKSPTVYILPADCVSAYIADVKERGAKRFLFRMQADIADAAREKWEWLADSLAGKARPELVRSGPIGWSGPRLQRTQR
jgi:hypothetical protein